MKHAANMEPLTDDEESIVLNYLWLKKMMTGIEYESDVYRYDQECDQWLQKCELNYIKNKIDNTTAINVIEAQQVCGNLADAYEINKQLINSLGNKISDIVENRILKNKFKEILRDN